jgi:general secretion pathway protein I
MRHLIGIRPRRCRRSAFSLLEVILAIAILTGAVAVLGELTRQGIESTRVARDTTFALLACESKMAEITSGATFPEQLSDQACDEAASAGRRGWLYSIDLATVDLPGLVQVTVTVYQDLPPEMGPTECSLVRWIVDPGVEFSVPVDTSQSESGTGTGTGTSSGTGGTTSK